MPIYEYVCDDCGERYERIVLSRTSTIECPKCESTKKTLQLSVFAAPATSSEGASASPRGGGCGCTPSSCGCH